MNLYQALQGVLDKVRENNEIAAYGSDADRLKKLLDNDERLSEGMLLLGGLLQALHEKEIEIQLLPHNKKDYQ